MMPEFPSKNKLPFDLVILLLDKSPRNPKSPVQKNLCTPMFIAAQFQQPSAGSNLGAHQ